MIRNYLKVALRNVAKQKFFSAINIVGMTIGITACLLIILYVSDELSFDRFHANADRMYQVGLHGKISGQDLRTTNTCPPLAQAMAEEIPDVEQTTRLHDFWGAVVKYKDLAFNEKRVYYADSNFFDFFSFHLLQGDPKTCLKEPHSVVLTEDMAKKYFGAEPAMGKLINISDTVAYKVTGITENCPLNSHFIYNILVSSSSSQDMKSDVWLNNYLYTYFILNKNGSLANVERQWDVLVQKYVGPEIEKMMGISLQKMKQSGGEYGYFPTKITDIHLHATTMDSIEPGGDITYVYFFSAIGVLIVIIACINFMNLTTAKSAGRAKEVGLRKALGSMRGQLIGQFLSESAIYTIVSIILSVVACYFLLPLFNELSGKELHIRDLFSPEFIIGVIGLVLFVGLIAGSYPAFYLTSFNAVEVLKGKVRSGMKSRGIRSFLVVFQFGISIFLIIFTATVYLQLRFMQHRDMGLDKKNVLVINDTWRIGNNREAFKNEINNLAGVEKSSFTNNVFPGVNNTTVFKSSGSEQDHIMGQYYADYDQLDVMKFQLKAGRYFSRDFPADTMSIVLNEAAVREFGFKDPLNSDVITIDDANPGVQHKLPVIGVLKDFNFEDMKMQIRPLCIRLAQWGGNLCIRYSGDPTQLVASTEKIWKEFGPTDPFEYSFLDDNFDLLFRSEQRMSSIFGILSGLAIFVACLGLFALAAFTAEQRTKEIGVRKAMGATVVGLTRLLSREFTKLVLIAILPASVLGWWVSSRWLNGFAYRTDLNPLIFVGSGVLAILIAWSTVVYQSVKAARANPANSLRYE